MRPESHRDTDKVLSIERKPVQENSAWQLQKERK
jgi:hypothetical protein